MANTHEHDPQHSHEHGSPKARGLRIAGTISLLKGVVFGGLALYTKNLPLAISSGHDVGDKLAFDDEAKAGETTNLTERAGLIHRASSKILWLTVTAGVAELALEVFSPIGHNDMLGLAGNAGSLALDATARHFVKNDSDHAHHEIGHTHADTDVHISAVNLAGNIAATASGQHWLLFPVAAYGIGKTIHSVRKMRAQADGILSKTTSQQA